MTAKLKDFIDQNAEAFNDLEAPGDGWRKLSDQLGHSRRKKVRLIQFSSMAAAAVLAGFILYTTSLRSSRQMQVHYSDIPELAEAEAYYSIQVSQRRESINQLAVHHPELMTEMNKDLAELDSIMAELKDDLKDNVSNAEVVEAMIQNYRMKLMILEDIKQYLQQENNEKKNNISYEL